jgi:hypothetical protein
MKLLLILSIVLFAACTSQKSGKMHRSPRIEVNDSTEYELIVFDNGFESWYALHNSEVQARSKEYYHNWNIQYVSEWNYRVNTSRHSEIYGQPIDYHSNENYPFEIEHKLFYYFQYVEHELGIPLLLNGPKVFN